jgi:hypothetical protein
MCLIKYHALKTYEGVEVQFHAISTSAQMEVSGQLYAPAAVPREKSPGIR